MNGFFMKELLQFHNKHDRDRIIYFSTTSYKTWIKYFSLDVFVRDKFVFVVTYVS